MKCHSDLQEHGSRVLFWLQPNLVDGFSVHKALLTENDRTVYSGTFYEEEDYWNTVYGKDVAFM